jgi:hypothetical protein
MQEKTMITSGDATTHFDAAPRMDPERPFGWLRPAPGKEAAFAELDAIAARARTLCPSEASSPVCQRS